MFPQATEFLDVPEKNGRAAPQGKLPLGYVDWDTATASNERVIMRGTTKT